MIISFLGQKGGTSKSSLARAVAVEFVKNNWDVHVADLDRTQQTFFKWAARRQEEGIEPGIEVALYREPKSALKAEKNADILIIDGKAFADAHALQVAESSNLIVIPLGISVDDVEPTLRMATELVNSGVDRSSIIFVVSKVPDKGEREAMATRKTIENWAFKVTRGWVSMKPAYSQAMDKGLSFTETHFVTLKEKADKVIQQIVDKAISDLEENS